ncbi:hypothetical protein [Clostridium sp. ZS2-4]|uniref:hypothetical protein n=1 Tax=Clostridium sp. ZS2-4 TaxID=2987703 RepID=UPI00227D2A76|nr:hypothetical protein [Clostridium sp. ZS2-4]MCY6355321.1 hypothetical protein [Clostridium sp. ZS2-4]
MSGILSTLPLVIGYVGETGAKDKKTAFKYSLFFSIGLVQQLSMSNKTMAAGRILKIVLGVLVIIMGLYLGF